MWNCLKTWLGGLFVYKNIDNMQNAKDLQFYLKRNVGLSNILHFVVYGMWGDSQWHLKIVTYLLISPR